MSSKKPALPRLAPAFSPPALDRQARPARSRHLGILRQDGAIAGFDLGWQTVAIEPDDSDCAERILALADGTRSLRALIEQSGIAEEKASSAVEALYELGALFDAGQAPAPALSFLRHLLNVGRAHLSVLQQGGGIEMVLAGGTPRRRLLVGYLVETYHHVSAAASHISPAIAIAPSEHLRMLLSEYLAGKYWHGLWLQGGLLRAGLTPEELGRATPLPATLAIRHSLQALAHTDFLAYCATSALQAIPVIDGIQQLISDRWGKIEALGLLPRDALAPFRDLELEEIDLEHACLFEDAFCETPYLHKTEQERLTRAVLGHAHTRAAWEPAIARFYQNDGPTVFSFGQDPQLRDEPLARPMPPIVEQAMARAEELAREKGSHFSSVSGVGRMLAVLAAVVPPNGKILESGTAAGVGTAWLVSGLGGRCDVTVTTVEIDPTTADIARRADWPPFVSVITGDILEVIGELGQFDLIFLDSRGGKWDGLDQMLAAVRPGGFLLVDDMAAQGGMPLEHTRTQQQVRAAMVANSAFTAVELECSSGMILLARNRPSSPLTAIL